MLLAQISPADPVTRLVLDGLAVSAPIINDIQFYSKPGAADSVKRKRDATAKTKITRSLNEDNSATPPTPVYDAVAKKIVSFDAKVDVQLEDRNEDPEAELALQTRLEAIQAGYVLQEMVFEGDSDDDSEDFDGLRQLVQPAFIKSGGGQLTVGSSDAAVANQQVAIEKLLQLIATVKGGASHLYMNEFLKMRWVTIAKNLGYYRVSIDELGKPIETVAGVVLRGAGYKEDGTPLLGFTESEEGIAGAGSYSSIFAVRWGERIDLTALTSVGVKGRYAGQSGNFLINNVNLDMVLHLQNHAAVVQSTGWKLD